MNSWYKNAYQVSPWGGPGPRSGRESQIVFGISGFGRNSIVVLAIDASLGRPGVAGHRAQACSGSFGPAANTPRAQTDILVSLELCS